MRRNRLARAPLRAVRSRPQPLNVPRSPSLSFQVLASGDFELKIDSFNTSRGACSLQPRDCRLFFRVCLTHSPDVANPEPPCTYGTALTDVFGADPVSVSESAPITVPFNFKWPVSHECSFTLKAQEKCF